MGSAKRPHVALVDLCLGRLADPEGYVEDRL